MSIGTMSRAEIIKAANSHIRAQGLKVLSISSALSRAGGSKNVICTVISVCKRPVTRGRVCSNFRAILGSSMWHDLHGHA